MTSSWNSWQRTHPQQRRALDDLASCHTAALGGHAWSARSAGIGRSLTIPAATATVPSARAQRRRGGWRRKTTDLLPTPYFHVVFTLPRVLGRSHLRIHAGFTAC